MHAFFLGWGRIFILGDFSRGGISHGEGSYQGMRFSGKNVSLGDQSRFLYEIIFICLSFSLPA